MRFRRTLQLLRWLPICAVVGVLAGSASALLLWSLDVATNIREGHHWLILLLAPAGLCVGLMYHLLGQKVEAGNNLILEEIHCPKDVIPLHMTPLILIGTFLTHLFGGSAGREGTALQTGASLADQLSLPFRMTKTERRILLMAGVSAGFASVFGTPVAGAVFGFEVLAIGRLNYIAIGPCFLSAFIADLVTKACRIHHQVYVVAFVPILDARTLALSVVAGIVFGLVAMAFARSTHALSALAKRAIYHGPLRPFMGGLIVSSAVFAMGTTRYIGLGIPTIIASFSGAVSRYDWAAKFLFTVVTLGSGFKGGEVTPLFFIGATLGNALSHVLALPPSLLAGMGFAAVFAGAANTPIASALMAMELFGTEAGFYAGIACVVSYLFSGHAGIYHAQKQGHRKFGVGEGISTEESSDDLL